MTYGNTVTRSNNQSSWIFKVISRSNETAVLGSRVNECILMYTAVDLIRCSKPSGGGGE